MGNDDVLCTEFKVACDICYCNNIGEDVTRSDVVNRLADIIPVGDVIDSMVFLINWGVVNVDISKGGLMLYISPDACCIISDLCRRYWMPVMIERSD